jgi:predicted  nucleic acid-binding Zn-ribbon protein
VVISAETRPVEFKPLLREGLRMSERTAEATTTVDEDGIRVEKSFTDDAFPVPAVTYELSSTRDDPVRVRIVDRIPESFPMDRIGFHPEYESENWTAYKDHRVEFERVLDPGDTVETVYGIRDDDPDLDGFLGTPVIEHVPVDEEIEDVLGTGDTDAVREVLSGDRATLPGMEDPVAEASETGASADVAEAEADAEVDAETPAAATADAGDAPAAESDDETAAPEPRTVSAVGTPAVTVRDDESGKSTEASEDDDTGESEEAADESEPASETAEDAGADGEDETGEESETGEAEDRRSGPPAAGSEPGAVPEDGIAAALAAEIRAGEVAEEDLDTLSEELDAGVPRSVDVRIARLQSSVADIEAYADALAEFIDGEGTAREILDELDRKVERVESEMDALDERVDAADADREDLRETVSGVDDSVDAVSTEVDAVTERVDGVSDRVDGVEDAVDDVEATVGDVTDDVSRIDEETAALDEALDDVDDDIETLYEEVDDAAAAAESTADRVEDVESRLGRFDEEFDDLWDDLAEVDTRLTEIEDRLGEDLDDVEAELDDINDHLEELEAFRERLNEAFGP